MLVSFLLLKLKEEKTKNLINYYLKKKKKNKNPDNPMEPFVENADRDKIFEKLKENPENNVNFLSSIFFSLHILFFYSIFFLNLNYKSTWF